MKRLIIISLMAAPVILYGAFALARYLLTEEYTRYASPEGRFHIVVYRQPMFSVMPGQGSDAPGYVELIGANGRVWERQDIEMVQLSSAPHWSDKRVSMKLQFDWQLPVKGAR